MPKAYWANAYHEIYDEIAGPAVIAAGGKFLVRGPTTRAYEAGLVQRTTVIEFDSLSDAIAAHETPEYQRALKALEGGVKRDSRIVEGVE